MVKWVLGDIHSNYRALKEVLELSGFDYENDLLIQLGDLVDRGPETYEVFEELLKIKNLILIEGNHDRVFKEWIKTGSHGFHWLHGGNKVVESYAKHADRDIGIMPKMDGYQTNFTFVDIPVTHRHLLTKQVLYFIDEDNNCFVHGGFNRHELLKDQSDIVFLWDRDLFLAALSYKNLSSSGYSFKMANKFKNVFIGHTPTTNWGISQPIFAANIINVDTGAGFRNGRLTIMNLETQEYFQSSKVKEKYLSYGR